MPEYVEREAVFAACNNGKNAYLCSVDCVLRKVPAADVVAVVRCRDCKHHQREQDPCHGRTEHYCKKLSAEVYKDFFCSYGERRGEDG